MDPTIEKELVAKAKQNKEDFSGLYEHYYPHIRRYFAVKLNKADLVDDLTSTTFEKAITNIQKFEWQGYPFSAWLYRIASNTLTDYFRKSGRNNTVGMPEYVQIESKDRSPEEQTEIDFHTKELESVIQDLPARDRKILLMKFYDGYTNKTISEKVGISESNVGTIVHRALHKLRSMLN